MRLFIAAVLAALLAAPIGTARAESPAAPPSSEQGASVVRFDLNTVTGEELVSVKGIGPALAEAILVQREARGGFGSVDDLLEIKGIGEKSIERLRGRLFVGPSTASTAMRSTAGR